MPACRAAAALHAVAGMLHSHQPCMPCAEPCLLCRPAALLADWRQGVERVAAALPGGVAVHHWRAPLLASHDDDYRSEAVGEHVWGCLVGGQEVCLYACGCGQQAVHRWAGDPTTS